MVLISCIGNLIIQCGPGDGIDADPRVISQRTVQFKSEPFHCTSDWDSDDNSICVKDVTLAMSEIPKPAYSETHRL